MTRPVKRYLGNASVDFTEATTWRQRGRLVQLIDGTYVLEAFDNSWSRVFPLKGRTAEVFLDSDTREDGKPSFVVEPQ